MDAGSERDLCTSWPRPDTPPPTHPPPPLAHQQPLALCPLQPPHPSSPRSPTCMSCFSADAAASRHTPCRRGHTPGAHVSSSASTGPLVSCPMAFSTRPTQAVMRSERSAASRSSSAARRASSSLLPSQPVPAWVSSSAARGLTGCWNRRWCCAMVLRA